MLFDQIARNKRRTIYVLIGFCLLVMAVGAAVGYTFYNSAPGGLITAVILAVGYSAVMIGNSTNVVMKMNHAHEISGTNQYLDLQHIVEDMALVARVPVPKVYVIDDESPNAFATGNNPQHAAVAATTGLLAKLNREELEGVMAHEMTHVRNYDIRLQTIALALAAVIGILVNFATHFFWFGNRKSDSKSGPLEAIMMVVSLILVILGPIAATIAQLALSRNREYLADAGAVELTRNPQGLIDALNVISDSAPMKAADASSAALYIADPFKKKRSWQHLFDTHPATPDRIARLQKM
ncbi:zinc metalloprotease HtpX [uncultured Secundilactobacillus sp.]|uniref:zinc metalloprotease HtpX n=1 Tax=uncultured Secundilactobacillus sp. TaxID=2813935 RepID=UPI00258F6BB5|nr:zinc metalloprotease HtpX [uncultured Secundilactobacillus sp.]